MGIRPKEVNGIEGDANMVSKHFSVALSTRTCEEVQNALVRGRAADVSHSVRRPLELNGGDDRSDFGFR